ncbi:dihydrolipoamide dehydrogenase [secondary endosymbiont of Heteropsylla cubana]|uniref:Dihydrolipoyl dehydrogenase n=1 Tax=secondary endosymbiont of Heteropsylla cubana TaxID=134287 RepID=J3TYR2_9ENTR|nr:dihydrolipoyl dehydrogenase [secondary endosymbiont of Heteropsylla cubana]AFP85555.1 dihydrolipoamide dehydrogenase [secondary endosymbiont of Heteropsylla cubana]
MPEKINTQVVVVGSGPGGYSAAFRCADLGLKTAIIERYSDLGGVCLNVGCIPSKTLLHIAKVITETKTLNEKGIFLKTPNVDINNVRNWKEKVVNQLTNGLKTLAKTRNIHIIHGYGKFTSPNTIDVTSEENTTTVIFEQAIIAAGSHPMQLSCIRDNSSSRIWNSTDALSIKSIPNRLLVMGGGVVGLEMATVYQSLGTKVDIVEMFDQVIPAVDSDIAKIFTNQITSYFNLMLETKVNTVDDRSDGVYVKMEGKNAPLAIQRYDAILVAIGRVPNGHLLNVIQTGIEVDNNGFIPVDKQMRTTVPHIYAIGDIVGHPMLAHKASYEGHIAAEAIAGEKHYFDPKLIPSIAYTYPEVGWVGITEKEAKQKGINYESSIFPWKASGRAMASDSYNGITKLLFDSKNHKLIGGAVVGVNGGELLGEISLAIEMGCEAEDIALTIHAHPTLYESIGRAAEIYAGTITDLTNSKIKV